MALIFSAELLPKVLDGSKTVTRRRSPRVVGSLQAVQPGRGKKGVGFVRVISCELHNDWWLQNIDEWGTGESEEANREGFQDWYDFEMKIKELYGQEWKSFKKDFYRIEFQLVK